MTKKITATLRFLCLLAFAALTLGLTACGSDGSDGARGIPGPPAPPPGVDIGDATEINAEITKVTIASPPVVDFTLTDGGGNAVRNLPAGSVGFYIAKLIPGTNGNASSWQSYVNVIDQPVGGSPGTGTTIKAAVENGAAGTLVENSDGSYRYTFSLDILNVTNPIPVSYQPTLTHRFTLEVRGFAPVINPIYDFRPSDGAQSGIFSREIVKTANCNVCHESLTKHGGRRRDTRLCVACHTPGSTDASYGNTFDAKVMFHKIHRGASLPSVINGGGSGEVYCFEHGGQQCFDDVVFPQDIRNCSNCHNENDPETPDAANWYKVPTVEACGSCHDDVNFETGAGHAAGPRDNSTCTSCHRPDMTSGLGAYQKHRILTQEGADRYSFNILNIDFLGPGNEPEVTFSVTDPTNNDAPYDLANDPDLKASNLLFYMAWDTTDYTNTGRSNAGAIRTSVYSSGVLQASDNGNFTYTLAVGMVPPTGATGSGAVSFAGNVTTSVGTLQVKATHDFFGITDDPANPVPRRTRVDINRCKGCHDSEIPQRHSDRNNNLDLCVLCHNPEAARGGNNGPMDFKYFIHRIHAVDGIRYPQRISNCLACHTDDGFYPVTINSGVRSTSTTRGANSSNPTDNTRITPNSAACSVCHSTAEAQLHMEQNGGHFDACQEVDGTMRVRAGDASCTTGAILQESCPTCHAKGRIADVAVTHSLNLD